MKDSVNFFGRNIKKRTSASGASDAYFNEKKTERIYIHSVFNYLII